MPRSALVVVVVVLLAACSSNEPVEDQAATTTVPLPEGIEPGESTPFDYSNPATLPELEGLTLAAAEQQARDRDWTTIENYTEDDYASLAFDADFVETRLRVIYEPDTGLVLEARVG